MALISCRLLAARYHAAAALLHGCIDHWFARSCCLQLAGEQLRRSEQVPRFSVRTAVHCFALLRIALNRACSPACLRSSFFAAFALFVLRCSCLSLRCGADWLRVLLSCATCSCKVYEDNKKHEFAESTFNKVINFCLKLGKCDYSVLRWLTVFLAYLRRLLGFAWFPCFASLRKLSLRCLLVFVSSLSHHC